MKDTKKFIFDILFLTILVAIMVVFSWTPLGMVPLGFASATTVFIPVAIGVCYFKKFKFTTLLGFFFGIVSLIRAFAPQGILDPYFQNPLVSVFPRLFLGMMMSIVCVLTRKLNKHLSYSLIGGLTALFNTIFTIGFLLIVYYNDINMVLNGLEDPMTIKLLLSTIILTNMIPEIILGAIVTPLVMLAIDKIHLRKDNNDVYEN